MSKLSARISKGNLVPKGGGGEQSPGVPRGAINKVGNEFSGAQWSQATQHFRTSRLIELSAK